MPNYTLFHVNCRIVGDICDLFSSLYATAGFFMEEKLKEISQTKMIFLNNINNFLSKNHWTIKNLSDYSNLPYESTKKLINGKVDNPSIYTISKIADALGCSVDFLLGKSNARCAVSKDLPLRAFTLLEEVAKFETYLARENQKNHSLNIPVFVPTGKLKDGFIFDSISTENIDISQNFKDYEEMIMCGFKITNTSLTPAYLNNDVLLLARDRYPQSGEIGVFLIGNKCYIRKYISGFPCKLECINGNNEPIVIKDIKNLHFIGRVLTVIRQ